MEEISKHNTDEDLWLVIDGDVLDCSKATNFDHPGGRQLLVDEAGKDASDAFEDAEHSLVAKRQLKDFKIGVYRPNK